jgi:hypothetical protein
MTTDKYSIDTNAFLTAWNETYRPASFENFWKRLEDLIAEGRAFASEEVLRELQKKDDGVSTWAKEQKGLFVPLEAEQLVLVKQLAADYPGLAKERLGRMRADGFVIGLAQWSGLVVVTAENRRGPDKIPNICDALRIRCVSIADMIQSEGWKF